MEHCIFCDAVELHLGDTESIATACARCSAWWAFVLDHDIMKMGKQPLDNLDMSPDFVKQFFMQRALAEIAERAILATYPPEKLAEMVTTCNSH